MQFSAMQGQCPENYKTNNVVWKIDQHAFAQSYFSMAKVRRANQPQLNLDAEQKLNDVLEVSYISPEFYIFQNDAAQILPFINSSGIFVALQIEYCCRKCCSHVKSVVELEPPEHQPYDHCFEKTIQEGVLALFSGCYQSG